MILALLQMLIWVVDMGFIDKFGKINRIYRYVGYLLILMIIGASYYFMFYTSQAEELDKTKKEHERLVAEIDRIRPKVLNYEQFKQEVEILNRQFSMLLEVLPNEKSYNLIYDQLVDIAEKNGLKVTLFQPTNETSIDDFHAKVNFNMNVEGGYLEFVNFLHSISFINRVINLNNFTVVPKKNPDGSVAIAVNMSMNSYMFKQATGQSEKDTNSNKKAGDKK
jgi:type IV pilus assembly protein PilO